MVSRETLLTRFAGALYKANERTNLVSRKLTRAELVDLAHGFTGVLRAVGLEDVDGVLDIGTGGGLPGIPLAIRYPGARVVLSESRRLRIEWLNSIVAELGLDNAVVLPGRVQGYPDLEATFPAVTAFGVGPPAEVIPLAARFLAPGGVAALSAPAVPDGKDESSWLLSAAVNGCELKHIPDALGGRALLRIEMDR